MHFNAVSGKPIAEHRDITPCKVYKQRWLILVLFWLYAISNSIQYIVYSVIADIIVEYYGVSFSAVQWTSLVKVVLVLIFNVPGAYAIDKLGLRWCVIIGLIGTCVGSWIKIASVDPSRFWVLIIGQGVTGLCSVLVVPLPAKIAATWFPKDQISLACSIGIIGMLVDHVFGFLLPPFLVQRGDVKQVEEGLKNMALIFAIFPTILLPVVLIFFKNAPPTPPSIAQTHVESFKDKKSIKKSLKEILTNRSFVIFVFIFSVCHGTAIPILIKANEFILRYHPDARKHVGFIGAFCMSTGIVSTMLFGYFLDQFKQFRVITITTFTLYSLSVIVFFATLSTDIVVLYFTGAFVGFLGMGLVAIGFNVSLELTYPESTSVVGAVLIASSQISTLIFIYVYTLLFGHVSDTIAISIIGAILIATVSLFSFVKFDMRRQKFEKLHEETDSDFRRY